MLRLLTNLDYHRARRIAGVISAFNKLIHLLTRWIALQADKVTRPLTNFGSDDGETGETLQWTVWEQAFYEQ